MRPASLHVPPTTASLAPGPVDQHVAAGAVNSRLWHSYLAGRELDWRVVTLEEVAGFVAWLRLPPEARDGRVAVPPSVEHHCTPSSVNRKLAVTSFYEFHARHGVDVGELLVTVQPAGRRRSAMSVKGYAARLSTEHEHASAHKVTGRRPLDDSPRDR